MSIAIKGIISLSVGYYYFNSLYLVPLIIVFTLNRILDQVAKSIFCLEAFANYDYIFLYDDPNNIANIVVYIFTDKFDTFGQMKAVFKNNGLRGPFKKSRSRLEKFMGRYYWSEMGSKDLDDLDDYIFEDYSKKNIHNLEQLSEFCASQYEEREPYDMPAIKYFI
jgi:hypothetical protein